MNKDDIKKALECCSNPGINSCKDCPYNNNGEFSCCDGEMYKDALNLITEQENEIEYRKKQYDNQVSENTRLYIEYDKLKDDYAKLQELFAQYQMASDKEIIAQKKQAVKDFAGKLKKYSYTDNCFTDGKWHRYVLVSDIDELIKEYE